MSTSPPPGLVLDVDATADSSETDCTLEESFANAVNAASQHSDVFVDASECVEMPLSPPNPGVLHLGDVSQSSETDDIEDVNPEQEPPPVAHIVSPQRELHLVPSPSKLSLESALATLEEPEPATDIGLPVARITPASTSEHSPRAGHPSALREKRCETKTIVLLGHENPSDSINGTYQMLLDLRHDGHPAFLRAPEAEADPALSRLLFMYFAAARGAWEIGPDLGKLESMIAYCVGDFLQLPRTVPEDAIWNIVSNNGEYEPDPAVRTGGSVFVGSRSPDPRDSPSDTPMSPLPPDEPETPDVEATTPPEGKLNRDRSKSFTQRARSSIAKKLKKLPMALDRTRARILRLALPDTPVDATGRLMERLRTARTAMDWPLCYGLVAEIQKVVRRPKSTRDSMDALRMSLLDVWKTLLAMVDKVEPIAHRERFFDTIIAAMVREELHLHTLNATTQKAPWVKEACLVMGLTHEYVANKLGASGMYESLLLFCAKALAINYFCIPGLAQTIIIAISRATPITGRRGRLIGQTLYDYILTALPAMARGVPADKRAEFEAIYRACRVHIGADDHQCPATAPKGPMRMPHSTLQSIEEIDDLMTSWRSSNAADLTDLFSPIVDGPWTKRFVTDGDAGFGFLSIFLEVLFRRCRTVFQYSSFRSKSDQLLGINESTLVGTIFMPGFAELCASYLRLALTTDLALKRTFRVGAGPPSVICNWSDRTAACALALSQDGMFLSCLLRDIVSKTSTSYVADVMSLLGSLKAFLESFDAVHEAQLPPDLDIRLFEEFVRMLLTCNHYVVVTFALRWLYDCIDYFDPLHRAMLMKLVVSDEVMNHIMCHWEPSVQTLTHMLVLYRLVDSRIVRAQLVNDICVMLESPSAEGVEDEPPAENQPKDQPAFVEVQRRCMLALRSYIWRLCAAHGFSMPPYHPCQLVQWKCPTHEGPCTCRTPGMYTRYASASLDQLRVNAATALDWLQAPRDDEAFPPLTVSVPPLQNMQSAYAPRPDPPFIKMAGGGGGGANTAREPLVRYSPATEPILAPI
eukprot:m.100094 g.100094  ORF g.100094 m.100094 type:complete len:1037 (-) comp8740_c0_seq3:198-3308(-)